MMIGEPPPTQADLHFRVFGVPVRVHPWFWVVTLFLGLGGSGPIAPAEAAVWVAAVFVSILIHELGHAFLQTRFGGHPRITLYSFGGLAACDDCDRSPRSQILISLAGPIAGFLFAAAVVLIVSAAGHKVVFLSAFQPLSVDTLISHGFMEEPVYQSLIFVKAFFQPFRSPIVNDLIRQLLWVNILWGVINLFPIYPLDGGRVARELFTLGNPRRGIIQSLWLSVGAAAFLAAWGLSRNSIYTAIMFGYLAYGSYQTLRAYQNYQS